MRTLLIHHHLPKNAGSFISHLLKNEYKDKFSLVNDTAGFDKVDFSSDLVCLELDPYSYHSDFYKRLNQEISLFDEVKNFTCLRHPVSRIISSVRYARKMGPNYGFHHYVRHIRGPYTNFAYDDLIESANKDIPFRYANPSVSSIIDFIVRCTTDNTVVNEEFSIGQTYRLSFGKFQEVCSLNKKLQEIVRSTVLHGDDLRQQFFNYISAPEFAVVGVQERFGTYLESLASSDIISKRSLIAGQNKIVNKGSRSECDHVEPALVMDFYLKYPIDFLLWGFFFERD
ncbi:hypothetical protein [Synechococcus sp. N26]|uniref:hypothetical protein n=1 Tax=Synechococcus sp. N26 TaxID=2575513 RepID=UPI0010BDF4FA|nr:hypothetical protein [Synechococcus sp. N26]